jgi:hypothetical protein
VVGFVRFATTRRRAISASGCPSLRITNQKEISCF